MFKYLSQTGLQVLKTAVEAGTFRAAAKQLHISQPAVSAHIHRIEQELGVELFERPYSKKLKLTESGQLVYIYAVEILSKNLELQKATRDLAHGELGQIKLAFSVAKFMLPSLLTTFRRQNPNIYFVLRSGNSARIQKLVLDGEVDFGLSLYTDNPQIEFVPFYSEPMTMICAPDHPLASQKYVSKQDLDKYGLLSGIHGSDYNRFIYNSFAAIGIHNLKVTSQVEDPETVLKIVEEGGGISLLLKSAAQKALERGHVVELSFYNDLKFPHMQMYQLFRKGVRLNTAAKLFIKFLNTEIKKQFPFITLLNNQNEKA